MLVCQEPHLPYDRTKLSKAMSLGVDKMLFRSPDFYEQNNVEVLSQEAAEIDASARKVSLVVVFAFLC